jgi:hypothetical protein
MFREAGAEDYEAVMGLYEQLHPADPVRRDATEGQVFAQILHTSGLRLAGGSWPERCRRQQRPAATR